MDEDQMGETHTDENQKCDAELEVRVNLNTAYLGSEPQKGMLSLFLDNTQKQQCLYGDFKSLLKYITTNPPVELTESQKNTRNFAQEALHDMSEANKICIVLYDNDFQPLESQTHPSGDIYLTDIVGEKVGDDPVLINMGLDTWQKMGYTE